jgi:trehalose-phosphatase
VECDVISASSGAKLADEITAAARRRGAARILALDLDGTLAPIVSRRGEARVPARVLDALSRLHRRGWRVAIVTGRSAAEARRMVPLRGVMIFGSHGIERNGASRTSRPLLAAARRAATIARESRGFVREFPGVEVERKPFGCAFHHRALHGAVRARFLRVLRAWLMERDTRGLELLVGKRVVELRPAGYGKGSIFSQWSAARAVRRRDRSLVAIGDDVADEELFAALDGRGLTVRIGSARRETIARRRVSGAPAVARLLVTLAADADRERHDG